MLRFSSQEGAGKQPGAGLRVSDRSQQQRLNLACSEVLWCARVPARAGAQG